MTADLALLREMLAEAEEEAVAFEALAVRAWALDDDERAGALTTACANRQERARLLGALIAERDSTGEIVGPVRDAEPEVRPAAEVRGRLRLVLGRAG